MKYILTALCVLLTFISCKEASKNKDATDGAETSSLETLMDTGALTPSSMADSAVVGVYQGIFPCADCDGIQQTILFKPDHTFAQEQTIWKKNEEATRSIGRWRLNGNSIELFQNRQRVAVFEMKGEKLYASMISEIKLKDSLKYILAKGELAGDREVWKQKKSKGIDFVGIGNEPFWNIEIKGSQLSFRLMEWNKPVVATIGEMEKNIDSTAYYLVTNNKNWTVKILPHLSSDGMSDYIYEYKVLVIYDGNTYHGSGIKL